MTGWRNVSAVVLAAYFIFLIGYVVAHPGIGYAQWHGLFATTDAYLQSAGPRCPWRSRLGRHVDHRDRLPDANGVRQVRDCIRFLFQAVCGVAMFAYFVWGVQILWGI
jgi:succinate dehydrogenase / fumarate reductase membrane anchor subunit